MNSEVMSLVMIFIFVIGVTIVGMKPGFKQEMNLEEFHGSQF